MSELDHKETPVDDDGYTVPEPSFETLVRSIVTQAQFSLVSYEGEGGKHEPDLRVARHYVDLLGMLQEKTKGNLTLDEERLLGNSLTELHFRYVQAYEDSRRKAASKTESTQA
ncbi:MAG TPA: DUF1844 domain-containing protein [Bryobacteraceae bacterium]|nr:DUF1844 domain-containing protein [Bryobacteraceae bacterium]